MKSYLSLHTQKIPFLRILLCLFAYQNYQILNAYFEPQPLLWVQTSLVQDVLTYIASCMPYDMWQSITQNIPWIRGYYLISICAFIGFSIGYRTRLCLVILLTFLSDFVIRDPYILIRIEGQFMWWLFIMLGIGWGTHGSIDLLKQQLAARADEGDQQLNQSLVFYPKTQMNAAVIMAMLMSSLLTADLWIQHHIQWAHTYTLIVIGCMILYLIPHWSVRIMILLFGISQSYECQDIRAMSFLYLAVPLLFPIQILSPIQTWWHKYYGTHLYVFYPAHIGFSHQVTRLLKRLDASRKVLWLGHTIHPFAPNDISGSYIQQRRNQGLVVYQPHTQSVFYDAQALVLLVRILPLVGPILYFVIKNFWSVLSKVATPLYQYYTQHRMRLPGQASMISSSAVMTQASDIMPHSSGAMRTQLVKILSLSHQNKQLQDTLEYMWYEKAWHAVSHVLMITLGLSLIIHVAHIPHQFPWRDQHPLLVRSIWVGTENQKLVSMHDQANTDEIPLLYVHVNDSNQQTLTLYRLTAKELSPLFPHAHTLLPYFMIYTQSKRHAMNALWLDICETLQQQSSQSLVMKKIMEQQQASKPMIEQDPTVKLDQVVKLNHLTKNKHGHIQAISFPPLKYQDMQRKSKYTTPEGFIVQVDHVSNLPTHLTSLNQMRWRCPSSL